MVSAQAARSEIAPRRQLASGGARVLRVDVAVDDAVEAHRGGARAGHRDDDAGDARDGQAVAARRDRGGGERERQREQRVLELDHPAEFDDLVRSRCRRSWRGATQRSVGVGSRTSDSSGAAMSSTSTSSTPGRAPGVERAEPRSPSARAPPRVAASSQRAAGTTGKCAASVAISAHSDRSGTEARLSVPIASAQAVGDQRVDVGQAAADVQVRARAEDDGRARLAGDAPIVGVGVDHVHQQRRRLRLERAQRREVRDGRFARARASTGSTPMPASSAGQRPRAVAQQRQLVFVLGDVDRGRAPGGGRGREDARQQLGTDGVGRVRRGHVAEALGPVGGGARRARARRRPARRRSRSRASRTARGTARRARPARPIPGAAASELPTSPIAAVPSATAAAAAVRGGLALRVRRCRPCGRSSASSPRRTGPCRPGRASTCADSSRWLCALTRPGSSTPSARSSDASGNSARTSARRPTASTAPSSASASAPSAIGGARDRHHPARAHHLHVGRLRLPSAALRRPPAARSACCAGAA